jgi:hypothetical protein
MAADNDLLSFADRNIEQMKQVGSSDNLNILIHLDTHRYNQKKITKRFMVQKNNLIQVGHDMLMDSGDAQTLVDSCQWALQDFPSEKFCLVIWNHGTGVLEPHINKVINSAKLFDYNSQTHRIELNRSIEFIDYITSLCDDKGICFDESTGHFITNHQLGEALALVCKQYRAGSKIDLICCDACLMSATEIAYSLKDVTHYFASSEEVVLATGYPYAEILFKASTNPTPLELVQAFVTLFDETYKGLTYDYTQSALDLTYTTKLTQDLHYLATLINTALEQQKNATVTNFLRQSSARNYCTYFSEPSYKDLTHLLHNFKQNITMIQLTANTNTVCSKILVLIDHALTVLNSMIIANACGENLKNAKGLSIYFPYKSIHPSYIHTDFGKDNNWSKCIKTYISSLS